LAVYIIEIRMHRHSNIKHRYIYRNRKLFRNNASFVNKTNILMNITTPKASTTTAKQQHYIKSKNLKNGNNPYKTLAQY